MGFFKKDKECLKHTTANPPIAKIKNYTVDLHTTQAHSVVYYKLLHDFSIPTEFEVNMKTIEIMNELRQLAKTPTMMYALQSNDLVLDALSSTTVSHEDLNIAFKRLSKESPSFALAHILEPFTYAFSSYLKDEHPVGRWPTTTEVAIAFKALNEHRLCPQFVEKRTRIYTIRKIISGIPEWNHSMSKGVRKQQDRLRDMLSVLDPFMSYVERKYVIKSVSRSEALRPFCKFILSELSIPHSEVENELVSLLIDKFESA